MTTPPNPVGVGFIGAGDISILHAKAVDRCPGAKLVGLWNRSPQRAEERAAEFGCRRFETAAALIDDPDVDAVFVLTNLETHLEYARLALLAKKPVLVEKPVAASVAELLEMKQLAEEVQVPCMPGHNYIYEESLRRSAELIAEGELGRLVSVYVMYNIHHPEEVAKRYPGVVRQILTHHSYILRFLAGRVRRVSAMKAVLHYEEYTEEDIAMATLELENGALAHFCASFAADDHAADPWTVVVKAIGTAGSTRYSYRDWVEIKPGLVHSQTYTAYQGSITSEVRHFVDVCIRGNGAPLSTLDDAIDAQRLIEAIEVSVAERRVVDLGTTAN
ncbi:MAG: oxidoreductase [Planctomycetes bacterium]|nr:oxidoreductase [Planctomycetota bacterium]